jgi:hypothetical protein
VANFGHDKILFHERQSFRQWWLWTILSLLNTMSLYATIRQLSTGKPIGDNPLSNSGLLFVTGVVILLTTFIYSLRLETQIGKDGVQVRFFPFHLTFRHYPWERLSKAYVRRYSALWEYGGWGLRDDFFGRGEAFNVSGNYGLQLEFTGGRKLLIGTQRSEEVVQVLHILLEEKNSPDN